MYFMVCFRIPLIFGSLKLRRKSEGLAYENPKINTPGVPYTQK